MTQWLSVVGVLVGIAAGLVALGGVGVALWRIVSRRRRPLGPLHQLTPGVNEEYTRRVLGSPPVSGILTPSGEGTLSWRLGFRHLSASFTGHSLQSWTLLMTDFGVKLSLEDFAEPVLGGMLGEVTFEKAAGPDQMLAGQYFQRTTHWVAYGEATQAVAANGGLAFLLAWNADGAGGSPDLTAVPNDTFDVSTGSFADGRTRGRAADLAHLRAHTRPNLFGVAGSASDFTVMI